MRTTTNERKWCCFHIDLNSTLVLINSSLLRYLSNKDNCCHVSYHNIYFVFNTQLIKKYIEIKFSTHVYGMTFTMYTRIHKIGEPIKQ